MTLWQSMVTFALSLPSSISGYVAPLYLFKQLQLSIDGLLSVHTSSSRIILQIVSYQHFFDLNFSDLREGQVLQQGLWAAPSPHLYFLSLFLSMDGRSLDIIKDQVKYKQLFNKSCKTQLFSGTCTSLIHPDRTILFSVCILVPYFFIIICYSRIIYHVKRAKRNIKSNQKWYLTVKYSNTFQ